MASAKQIKARKLFALRSKRGDFRKGKKSSSGFKQISKADFDKSRSAAAKTTLARMSKKPKSKITQELKKEMRY